MTDVVDPSAAYHYGYDQLGQNMSQTQLLAGLNVPIFQTQAFDLAGNRTLAAAAVGTTADFVNTYAYDNLHRQTQVIQQGAAGNAAVAAKRVDWSYDANGQRDMAGRSHARQELKDA